MSRPVAKIPTRIPGFDDLALGGLPEGSTTLVSGPPGSGKTVFVTEFLTKGIEDRNENGVLVTLEESPERLRKYMAGFGWDIEEMERRNQWAFVDVSPHFDDPPFLEIGEFDLGALMARIQHAIEKVNAKRLVIASLAAVLDKFNAQGIIRHELYRLTESLRRLGVLSLITLERRHDDNVSVAYRVEDFVVDNVILLRNRLEVGSRRRTIEILKFRGSPHSKGELPLSITSEYGLVVIPLTQLTLQRPASSQRVTSGVEELDELCQGGFFQGSVILVTGATGCGKTLLSTEFVNGGVMKGEKALLCGFEESHDQLARNADSWGMALSEPEKNGLLKVHCTHPEAKILEEHLIDIKAMVDKFQPQRLVIDSLSALERIASRKGFREFVLAVSGAMKEREITTMFTLTTPSLMGGGSVTEGHISSITDCIILLRYVELSGEVRRGLTVLKMRGSHHDHRIREFVINNRGMHIQQPFTSVTGILMGSPIYIEQPRTELEEGQ